MRVWFKTGWFAPSESVKERHILHRKGQFYRPGIHDNVPDSLRKHLPSNAKIMDDAKPKTMEVKPSKGNEGLSLKDFDPERAAADAVIEAAEKAEANTKK